MQAAGFRGICSVGPNRHLPVGLKPSISIEYSVLDFGGPTETLRFTNGGSA